MNEVVLRLKEVFLVILEHTFTALHGGQWLLKSDEFSSLLTLFGVIISILSFSFKRELNNFEYDLLSFIGILAGISVLVFFGISVDLFKGIPLESTELALAFWDNTSESKKDIWYWALIVQGFFILLIILERLFHVFGASLSFFVLTIGLFVSLSSWYYQDAIGPSFHFELALLIAVFAVYVLALVRDIKEN